MEIYVCVYGFYYNADLGDLRFCFGLGICAYLLFCGLVPGYLPSEISWVADGVCCLG